MKMFVAQKDDKFAVQFEAPNREKARKLLDEHNMSDYNIFWESREGVRNIQNFELLKKPPTTG